MRLTIVQLTSFCMVLLAIVVGVAGIKSISPTNPASTSPSTPTSKPSAWLSMNWRRSKLPILPPRLRLKTKENPTTTAVSTDRDFDTTTTEETTTSVPSSPAGTVSLSTNDTVLKQGDVFELSSSDNSPSVAWPVPRRPASRRLWSSVTPRSTAAPLPKLLLPRPTRPAMYSLDGFVPKPSIVRITTTEAPDYIKRKYSEVFTKEPASKRQNGRVVTSQLQKDSSTKRIDSRKLVSRFTASARRGVPGQDYPIYNAIPSTSFDCGSRPGPGMYADPETDCQIWHICPGATPHRYSFMCPNGTVFNEVRAVCDWWYNVPCDRATAHVVKERGLPDQWVNPEQRDKRK